MSERREFTLSSKGMSSPLFNVLWLLVAFYVLWRIGQVIMGIVPPWFAFEGFMGIVYVWVFRFRPVKAITVERDGNVIFDRYLGRCEVNAIYIQRVRPFFHVFKDNFVVTHAEGSELLFGDAERIAELVRELSRFNPEIEVTGVPLPPAGVAQHVA